MRSRIWNYAVLLGILASILLFESAQAQSTVILPVDEFGIPIVGSSVTVSILEPETGTDITSTWVPEPGQSVQIEVRVGGLVDSVADIRLVFDPVESDDPTDPADTTGPHLTTSAYPGQCGNVANPADAPPDGRDFELIDSSTLRAWDCGGMAVVDVTPTGSESSFKFVLPRDDDVDGIANTLETLYCPGGDCDRNADIDTGPDGLSPERDGWRNIDELRGWLVNGSVVRGDPAKKDIFLHLEETPQCTDTAGSFTGDGGADVDLAFFFGPSLEGLFDLVDNLSPGVKLHFITSGEWVDNLNSYDVGLLVRLSGAEPDNRISDRQVNRYAIQSDGEVVKGIRMISCHDLLQLTPLGRADKNPPNLDHKDNGNAVIFLHRIVFDMLKHIKSGAGRKLRHMTYDPARGKWVTFETLAATFDPADPSVSDPSVNAIIKRAIAWYLAHETTGHSLDLTTTSNLHHPVGAGSVVDLRIMVKIPKNAGKPMKFYIPTEGYLPVDLREIRLLQDQ